MNSLRSLILVFFLAVFLTADGFVLITRAQIQPKSTMALFKEARDFVNVKARAHQSAGKRLTRERMGSFQKQKKSFAKRTAKVVAARTDLTETDYYYLGRLYFIAEDHKRSTDAMKTFFGKNPDGANSEMAQSARSFAIISASRVKRSEDAEKFFMDWQSGTPIDKSQKPFLQSVLSVGLFKDKEYEKAVKHALDAFETLKTANPTNPKEIRDNEKIYMRLVEVLALGYKKTKNKDNALAVLAEARVRSFALPSAALYRKVMDFVEGSGFSEKKLMRKVESLGSGNPAPEIEFVDWLRREPANVSDYRGKIVLLDFWATWCGPCISTFPRLRKWQKKYKEKGFEIVGVAKYYGQADGKRMTPLQELDYIDRFAKKYKLNYPIAVAEGGEDSKKYGINAYPTTLLLDRNGIVRYIGIGAGSEEIRNLEGMIKKLIKEDSLIASQK